MKEEAQLWLGKTWYSLWQFCFSA